ncbi:MAG: hypothetical protein FJ145_21240 [Deltaproteobacteria bacterium]|nr:hypothetical protein [Deltaproteobacteria bacterium]
MAFKFPWSKESHGDDPYWDFFVNTQPADMTNTVIELIRKAPPGNVFPTKTELHTPAITASHVKGMALYFGSERTGILALGDGAPDNAEKFPFAILCAVRDDYDARSAKGIGGQMPVQNGLFITFVLSSWIRELGFRAKIVRDHDFDAMAGKAGMGTLNGNGRLVTQQFGTNIYVADAVYTDMPMKAD